MSPETGSEDMCYQHNVCTEADELLYWMYESFLGLLVDCWFPWAEFFCWLLQNQVDEAMAMYQELHKWDDAINVAEAKVGSELFPGANSW